jgi:hypothetical protein
MKLNITKSQNGGYLVEDVHSKKISVVASCESTGEAAAEDKQKLELGKIVAGLVDEWYEKGQDKIVSIDKDDDDDDDGEGDEEGDGELPSDFITAIGKEMLKFARKVPSRHKPRDKKESKA